MSTDAASADYGGREIGKFSRPRDLSAARLTQYKSAAILDTLAESYTAAQQFDLARTTLETAIQQARQQGQIKLVNRLEAKRARFDTNH